MVRLDIGALEAIRQTQGNSIAYVRPHCQDPGQVEAKGDVAARPRFCGCEWACLTEIGR